MDDKYFDIEFNFKDILSLSNSPEEPEDFVNEIYFDVFEMTDDEEKILVAKGKFSLILFSLAMDHGYSFHDLIDATQSISEMAEVIFDLEDEYEWEKLERYFEDKPIFNYNICFIEKIEVLPLYRGKGLSQHIVRNIVRRFYSCCGLWVLKAYPLQHDNSNRDPDDDWYVSMNYGNMEEDFEKSQYKLFNHYQKMGFRNPFDAQYFIALPEQLC